MKKRFPAIIPFFMATVLFNQASHSPRFETLHNIDIFQLVLSGALLGVGFGLLMNPIQRKEA
jgi:hypothetical protein